MGLIFPSQIGRQGKPYLSVLDRNDPINYGRLGYWPLDDVGSGFARCLSPYKPRPFGRGTLVGSPKISGSHHGGVAASLNGSTDYVSIASDSLFWNSTLSCAIWVNAASLANAYSAAFSRVSSGATNAHQLLVKSNGTLGVYVLNDVGAFIFYDGSGSHALSTGNWYLISFSYDANGGLVGYVNGVQDALVFPNGNLAVSGSAVTAFGTDTNTGGRLWNGLLADASQWNRTLSATEHKRLFTEPYAGIVSTGLRRRLSAQQADTVPFTPWPQLGPICAQ